MMVANVRHNTAASHGAGPDCCEQCSVDMFLYAQVQY